VHRQPRIAVLIPCRNEVVTVARTVAEFRAAISSAIVYVYDNNSVDGTVREARESGAVVRHEPLQGKGHVVRRMFSDINADIYVMVDGDATYDATTAQRMIDQLIQQNLDMVVGKRVQQSADAYRRGHVIGNKAMTGFMAFLFGRRFSDVFSGYRVFSHRFVKSFPALCSGFETETELTVHALTLGLPIAEVQTNYFARLAGSKSKLNTWLDGVQILLVMLALFRNERPMMFFGSLAFGFAILSLALATPLLATFAATGLVPRFPTAILCAAIMLLAFLSFASGLILDTVTRGRREVRRLAYLQAPSIQDALGLDPQSLSALSEWTVGRAAGQTVLQDTTDTPTTNEQQSFLP
jgi:hypothetical protein